MSVMRTTICQTLVSIWTNLTTDASPYSSRSLPRDIASDNVSATGFLCQYLATEQSAISESFPSLLSPYGHLFKQTCQLKHSLRYFVLWVLNSASCLSSLCDLSIFNCQLQLTHKLFPSHFWNVSFSHVFAILFLQQFLATYKSIVLHFQ